MSTGTNDSHDDVDDEYNPIVDKPTVIRPLVSTLREGFQTVYGAVSRTYHTGAAHYRMTRDTLEEKAREHPTAAYATKVAAASLAGGLAARYLVRRGSPRLQVAFALLGAAGGVAALHPKEVEPYVRSAAGMASSTRSWVTRMWDSAFETPVRAEKPADTSAPMQPPSDAVVDGTAKQE